MGYKIGHIALALACPYMAAAADFNISNYESREDGGLKSSTTSIVFRPSTIGVRTSETRYTGGQAGNSRGVAADLQFGKGPLWVEGWIGRSWIGSKGYLDAELEGSYDLGGGLSASGGFTAGTIYGGGLPAGQITQRTASIGMDYNAGIWGAAGSVRAATRNDGNGLSGGSFKVWRQVAPGTSLYISGKSAANDYRSPLYYSPISYNRVGLGATWRKFWSGGSIGLTLEPGTTYQSGTSERVLLWRAQLSSRPSKESKVEVAAGRDYSRAGSYYYNYRQITLKVDF